MDDPWVMYYVVRSGVPFSLERAMASAGAAAVECVERFAGDERFAPAFEQWHDRPRKVALRADSAEFGQTQKEEPCSVEQEVLLCLPPRRRSDRSSLLEALQPFTDAPRPKDEEADSREPAMTYVVRRGVMRTAGKAMAQAGHAALMASERFGRALDAWRDAGMPGDVRLASEPEDWERLRALPDAVVVQDAGLTQVEAGTETVVAFAPGDAGAAAVADLERVP
jgi:peptidyl-tRNA hydrolase